MILSACFFLVGWIVAIFMTPWMIRLSERGIGLDDPNETRKQQDRPVSRLGGAPLCVAALVGLAMNFWIGPKESVNWAPILVGSVLMFGLGLWDDLKALGARKKLIGQILIASLAWWMGLSIDKVTYPGARWSVQLDEWSYFITVFWLIAVPNIVNLIDGFDGLAGGLGLFLSATLGVVAIHNEQLEVAYYAFTCAGALVGFLVFNFPPARIYLGDGGAYLIGFTIASLSLNSSNKASVAAVLLVTVVALGIPILDTTFALVRRAVRGYPIFHADDEHFHHRLYKLGLTKQRVLLSFYGIAVIFSLLGLSIIWSQGRSLPIAIGAVFLLAIFVLRYFHDVGNWEDLRNKADRVFRRRRYVRYALLQAQLLDMEIERCQTEREFWGVFYATLRRVGFTEPGEVEDEVAIHVRYNGSTPWTLHASKQRASASEWARVAECFRPVYARAKDKWRTN
jgi:UDP-GlcNAc:undecaprenyl-phosphate/decaprenyl-phosphate GlcNAc-1-phosphate transferase